ncbi:hypothetical protein FHG87_004852 [Trinorchestia longiramus]|nr:hypothetical protein FHG87_004852 [Trinorchestia longiramus]
MTSATVSSRLGGPEAWPPRSPDLQLGGLRKSGPASPRSTTPRSTPPRSSSPHSFPLSTPPRLTSSRPVSPLFTSSYQSQQSSAPLLPSPLVPTPVYSQSSSSSHTCRLFGETPDSSSSAQNPGSPGMQVSNSATCDTASSGVTGPVPIITCLGTGSGEYSTGISGPGPGVAYFKSSITGPCGVGTPDADRTDLGVVKGAETSGSTLNIFSARDQTNNNATVNDSAIGACENSGENSERKKVAAVSLTTSTTTGGNGGSSGGSSTAGGGNGGSGGNGSEGSSGSGGHKDAVPSSRDYGAAPPSSYDPYSFEGRPLTQPQAPSSSTNAAASVGGQRRAAPPSTSETSADSSQAPNQGVRQRRRCLLLCCCCRCSW